MRCVSLCPVLARKVSGIMTSIASIAIKKACSVEKADELFNYFTPSDLFGWEGVNHSSHFYKYQFSLIKSLSSFYTLYYKPDVNFIHKATKTGQKSCLIVNFYYLPLNVYVDACLEENRELVIKNLNTLYVVPDHPFVVIGKF